jgi:tripartite-type tricarboxylate transporter receptor subunit TctC
MKRLIVSLCAAAILWAAPALAETIRIIVPFAAGGPVDQLARILAHELTPLLGADVIVEDRSRSAASRSIPAIWC